MMGKDMDKLQTLIDQLNTLVEEKRKEEQENTQTNTINNNVMDNIYVENSSVANETTTW